jgi:hypothetical protein
MNPSLAPKITEVESFVYAQDLLDLAKFSGGTQDDLVSFYFSLSPAHDGSHRQEFLMVRDLVEDAVRGIGRASPVAGDLESLLTTVEEIRRAPSRLRAVFSCKSRNFRRQFDLPASGPVSYLNIGRSFHLAPILRAMDLCLPYCVVLIEHGKARGFVVRGTDVSEVPRRFPDHTLSQKADDSRVGWSHHVSGNRAEHGKAYFRALVPEVDKFLSEQGSRLLVIGCHDSIWGEIAPHLSSSEWTSQFIGRFNAPNFKVSPFEVLGASRPAFEQYLTRRYLRLWEEIDSTTQCALALDEIVQMVEQGRVRQLVLGKPSDQMMAECSRCGHLQTPGDSCQYCRNSLMLAVHTQEGLIARSLLTDAGIALPSVEASNAPEGVAALLRF